MNSFLFVSGKFYLVDFLDGPQVVRGEWLADDRKYSAWPSGEDIMQPMQYDKFVVRHSGPPDPNWQLYPVSIRAYSGKVTSVIVCRVDFLPKSKSPIKAFHQINLWQ